MLETLYKTGTPKASVWDGEYYELFLHAKSVKGRVVYLVEEKHGWWDDEAKRNVNSYTTLSPEEGYATFEDAQNRYKLQRSTRAKGGFTHSFSPDYSEPTKHVYEFIKPS
jgi:hypothetical protein